MINTEPCEANSSSAEAVRLIAASGTDRLPDHGKFHDECGSAAGHAVDANLTGMFLNDAVGHGESQACAARVAGFGFVLGGEERIVDTMNVLLRNAGAGIGH